jgi:phosphate-selective porin OprO and OprP
VRISLRAALGFYLVFGSAAGAAAEGLVIGTPGEKSLRISGWMQGRFTGYDQSGADKNSFRIRRARLRLDGDATSSVKYELMVGSVSRTLLDTDHIELLDADVGIDLRDYLLIKAGQFKAPFGREFLTTSAELESPERALIEGLIPNRQIGAMVTSTWDMTDLARGSKEHRIDYGVGAFNGNGRNRDRNDNTDVMFVGRVVARPHEHFSIGANGFTSKDSPAVASPAAGLNVIGRRTGFGVDARVESARARAQAEYVQVDFDPEPTRLAKRTLRGFYVQPGVFVVPERLEAWVRYEQYDPDADVKDSSDKRWTHLGLNWFISKDHSFKLQAEYVLRREDGLKVDDDAALAQLQVAW